MRVIVVIGLVAAVSATVALGGEGATKPPELKVLDRFVGTWDAESVSRPAVWTPKEVRVKYVEVRELTLDGWFVESKGRSADEKAATTVIWMMTYDSARKEYRQWLFATGGFSLHSTGQWDEATETLSCTGDAGNVTMRTRIRFIDKDHVEFRMTAKDSDGKVYQDTKGTLTRRGDTR
jgi:hypothetical protein